MAKVIYLMGAGASRGKRTTDLKLDDPNPNTIIEGLPIVSEIPGRLNYVLAKLREFEPSNDLRNFRYPFNKIVCEGYENLMNELCQGLEELKEQCSKHATIDIYAKKLYLKEQYAEFSKVECLLSIFLILEQVINKPDSRYDTFLASVLNQNLKIDENIGILTWNYDSQFEIAYKGYCDSSKNNFKNIQQQLGVYDAKTKVAKSNNSQIIKLNGTANFKDFMYPITDILGFNDNSVSQLLGCYVKYKDDENKNESSLSFAWESNEYIKELELKVKGLVSDAETLVVIGYTFPFFNREIDRMVFRNMPYLKNIYIQDPNAGNIVDSLMAVASTSGIRVDRKIIHTITACDQFYLPPQL